MNKKTKNNTDFSVKVPQRDKIHLDLHVKERPDLTDKQKEFAALILDRKTNVVFLRGPAGTSKSFLAVYCGLLALNSKAQSDILYIRAPVEVGKSIGYVPGTAEEKASVYLAPLQDKLEELLPKCEVDALVKDHRVTGTVPNFLRGQSWNARFVIVDEAQNICPMALKTILTRLGKYSKIIFCSDQSQADNKGPIESSRYFDLFNNEESREKGIYCLSFLKEDIVRNGILGYILDKIES